MEYNLEGKVFKSIANTENGEVDGDTLFRYHQDGNHVWAEYAGGSIVHGHLVAIKQVDGTLEMHYHHINDQDEVMIGRCTSTPALTAEGKLLFNEQWQWLNGDKSHGTSKVVEI